jgi:hypothetical protein
LTQQSSCLETLTISFKNCPSVLTKKVDCLMFSLLLIPWIMVGICSFGKHGPYGFVFTHCTLSCKENIMNCIGIFATPPCVALSVYIHTSCNLCITWENHLFLYFIFVQHWTCDSGFFRYYIYCSLHGTVDTGYTVF